MLRAELIKAMELNPMLQDRAHYLRLNVVWFVSFQRKFQRLFQNLALSFRGKLAVQSYEYLLGSMSLWV